MEGIFIILIMLCGFAMMGSSVLGGRTTGCARQLLGIVIAGFVVYVVFGDYIIAMILRISEFLVEWGIRIGAVALVLAVISIAIRIFSSRR